MTPECVPESAREGRQRLVEGLGGDKGDLKGPWTATSRPPSRAESEGLSRFIGWGTGVNVRIINPCKRTP